MADAVIIVDVDSCCCMQVTTCITALQRTVRELHKAESFARDQQLTSGEATFIIQNILRNSFNDIIIPGHHYTDVPIDATNIFPADMISQLMVRSTLVKADNCM